MPKPLSDERLRGAAEEAEFLATCNVLRDREAACTIRALLAEVSRLRASIQLHHDQWGDNRCHLDDLKLYHDALGIGDDPYVCALPPDADMEESCRRYIRQRRCPSVVVPLPGDMTIQQLTEAVERLQGENDQLRRDTGRAALADAAGREERP